MKSHIYVLETSQIKVESMGFRLVSDNMVQQ